MSTAFFELVRRQARAWEEGDVEAILADFAPEATFLAPGTVLRGHEEIRAGAEAYFARYHAIRARINRMVIDSTGRAGAVEWHWSATNRATGVREGTPDGIIVDLRDGLVTRWREYFDTATDEPEPPEGWMAVE
ncbi:MAG: SgcJ/EcaC family oxidoreductase [Chloroflexota bacterium]